MRATIRNAPLIFAALAIFTCPALAQQPPAQNSPANRISAMDIFHFQYALDPQISPDGSKIVYVRDFADIMTDKRDSNLWIVNADGTENRPLTTGAHSDDSPKWSPDGTRIAYISDRDGKSQIYVRWMDTGQTAKITDLGFPPMNVAWSPDGKQIAFSSLVLVPKFEIGALPQPPEGAKWADPPRVFNRLIYRFNGRGYLPSGFTQLFVVASDGGAPRQISSGNFPHDGQVAWTPDGQYLLESGHMAPDYEYFFNGTQVYQFSLADGSMKQLTNRKGPNNSPAISPDGKMIAYTGYDDHFQGYQVTHLYVMDRDGGNPHELLSTLDRDTESPQWAPDGSGIYFLYDDQGNTKLGFVTPGGKMKTVAKDVASGGSTYTEGGSFTLARNGAVATTYGTGSDPGDIAVAGGSDSSEKVITALNRELLAQKKPSAVEEFWFNSSVDKRKVEGWIIKPPDFDPAKKYPLLLEIHGGPFANYGNRFDIEKQIWASAGYVVVYINPRGSTSYGEEFGNLIHHAYPGDDFYDLNSAVDAVIAKGYIDSNNLFVTGGSGGGVLTCWMIDRTNRFRAAASLYPVVNWYSWTLTTDIPILGSQYWFPGPPWEYPDQYMKRSVISLVGKVQTPTMLMTGEADYRTPISEAEQYYAALKLRKIEAVLVRMPDEPHGVSVRPSHQIAKVLYVEDWFNNHRSSQ
ncbi:MAG TPA: S9 family peptidase [Candidatus Acidoferrales bacterium]|nr:S9 family peptidase [Candidatus Acidoferrales bacterium]